LAERLAAALPEAEVRVANGQVVVRGLIEDHEVIGSGGFRTSRRIVKPDDGLERKTFTLTATNQPAGVILERLRQQLNLEIQVDAAALKRAGKSLDTLVNVATKEATLDATLEAILSPAGLKFRREDRLIYVEPGE
jgi:hypothetical protein